LDEVRATFSRVKGHSQENEPAPAIIGKRSRSRSHHDRYLPSTKKRNKLGGSAPHLSAFTIINKSRIINTIINTTNRFGPNKIALRKRDDKFEKKMEMMEGKLESKFENMEHRLNQLDKVENKLDWIGSNMDQLLLNTSNLNTTTGTDTTVDTSHRNI